MRSREHPISSLRNDAVHFKHPLTVVHCMILDILFPHPLYATTNPSLTKENNDTHWCTLIAICGLHNLGNTTGLKTGGN